MPTREEINSKLVEEVKKHPLLYDTTHNQYSRRDLRNKAWEEISREVSQLSSIDVATCKKKWTSFRSSLIKELTASPSASASREKTPYYLREKMLFITPHLKNAPQQERESDIDNSDNEDSLQSPRPQEELQQPVQSPACPPSTPPARPQEQGTSGDPPSTPPARPQEQGTSGEQATLCNLLNTLTIQNDENELAMKAEPAATRQANTTKSNTTKQFLLSLLTDLELMNENQLRQFKRKCLDAIDEILMQTH